MNHRSWLGGILGGFIAVGACFGLVAANAPGARLARGFIMRGNSSNVAAAYDANDSGKILVGDGTDLVSVDFSGDGDLSSGGAFSLTANNINSADVATQYFQVDNTQLSNTNVVNASATPITLIADPGDGFAVLVHDVFLVLDDAAGAWTESNDNLVIEYATGQDILMIEATGLVGGAVTNRQYKPVYPVTTLTAANTACSTTCGGGVASTGGCLFGMDDGAADAEVTTVCSDAASDRCFCQGTLTLTASEAVQIKNIGDGEWGGGNAANTLSIRIYYSIVPTAAFSSGG